MRPCVSDSPVLLDRQQLLMGQKETVFFITRNKNSNVVVYKAHRESDGRLNESKPIDAFWMEYEKNSTSVSEADLRTDLIWIESKMAYGVHAKRITGTLSSNRIDYELELVALPSLKPSLYLDSDGIPRVRGQIGGRDCYMYRVHVHAKENMIGLPTVKWINIHGIDCSNGDEIVEKIQP